MFFITKPCFSLEKTVENKENIKFGLYRNAGCIRISQ
jgi:hypothetical protein